MGENLARPSSLHERKRRYMIESSDLAESFHVIGERTGPDNLVTFLNRSQSFSVLPDSSKVIFADGEFFSPKIAMGTEFDSDRFQVGKIMQTHKELETLTSEKGNKANMAAGRKGWHKSSVFGWLDGNLDQLLDEPELVICDDMGTETADFIALDQGRLSRGSNPLQGPGRNGAAILLRLFRKFADKR